MSDFKHKSKVYTDAELQDLIKSHAEATQGAEEDLKRAMEGDSVKKGRFDRLRKHPPEESPEEVKVRFADLKKEVEEEPSVKPPKLKMEKRTAKKKGKKSPSGGNFSRNEKQKDSFRISDDLRIALRKLGRFGEQPSEIILRALRTKESLLAENKRLKVLVDNLKQQNLLVVDLERKRKRLSEDKKLLIQYVKKLEADMKLIGKEQEAYEKYIAALEGRPKKR